MPQGDDEVVKFTNMIIGIWKAMRNGLSKTRMRMKFYRRIGRTQIPRVQILAPWAKGAQNDGEKWVFCDGYLNSFSL